MCDTSDENEDSYDDDNDEELVPARDDVPEPNVPLLEFKEFEKDVPYNWTFGSGYTIPLTSIAGERADQLLLEYEEAVGNITQLPCMFIADTSELIFYSHFHPPLKKCLELVRAMRKVKDDHRKADSISKVLFAKFSGSMHVHSSIDRIDEFRGRCGGGVEPMDYITIDAVRPYGVDMLTIVEEGKVGKILWRILKSSVYLCPEMHGITPNPTVRNALGFD
jgi:hypothetical protein